MDTSTIAKLRIGAWAIEPTSGQMTRGDETVRLEPRMLRLLLCLAERAGQVVSANQLLDEVWAGVVVSPDSVYQAIASLRRLLGDDPKQPAYIMTVPRKGYRMVAEVGGTITSEAAPAVAPVSPAPVFAMAGAKTASYERRILAAVACAILAIVITAAFWMHNTPAARFNFISASSPQKSIAVLPFLDLTEEMKEEYFADGITEELIGRFSKIGGFKVPSPTSSFYYKNKQIPVDEFAKKLGVTYVLDGSVRKSGTTMRIAARLMKADDGFVIWSATYDRPVDDLLMVQDDIGEQVSKALKAAINQ